MDPDRQGAQRWEAVGRPNPIQPIPLSQDGAGRQDRHGGPTHPLHPQAKRNSGNGGRGACALGFLARKPLRFDSEEFSGGSGCANGPCRAEGNGEPPRRES